MDLDLSDLALVIFVVTLAGTIFALICCRDQR